jgi:caa(3)-type oxidase subunit IV
MTEPANPEISAASHDSHGPSIPSYLAVFGALSVFTLISFVANLGANTETITVTMAFTIILGVAVVKALLVATWFMHLRWDWPKVYIMIVPALILGPLLVIVLLPDIVLAWKHAAGG